MIIQHKFMADLQKHLSSDHDIEVENTLLKSVVKSQTMYVRVGCTHKEKLKIKMMILVAAVNCQI